MVNESAGTAIISVQLATPFAQTVYVDYTTANGTARAGSDYITASGTLIFTPGETNRSFPITILSDSVMETNETVLLSLSGLVNAIPGQYMTATLNIFDDARLALSNWQTNSGFHSMLIGPAGRVYAIDASSNLVQWLEITRLTNTTGTVNFVDPDSLGIKRRFYRARQTN